MSESLLTFTLVPVPSHFSVLIYEPDNPECKQFQPLIEEMLRRGERMDRFDIFKDCIKLTGFQKN